MEFFDCSPKELETIHQELEPKLAWAKTRVAETERMALDATRLLSCTEDRLNDYMNQGFFKRCWNKLCGKQGEMMRANQKDLTEMQKYAWQYINLLNERDLLLAHSMITVKNNLMTLAIAQEETKNEIARMAEKVYERFVALENRVKDLEISTNIHSWLLILPTYDYDEKYSPHFRMLKIIREFMELKEDDWNIRDIKYLQQAIKQVGLPWKEKIKISDFIDELIDEIEASAFSQYQELLLLPYDHSDKFIPGTFILENIPAPSFASLYQISDNYAVSSTIIDALAEQLNVSKKEAMKTVMTNFISKQGIDLEVSIQLRDLAVELFGCMKLAKNLFGLKNIDQSQQVHEDISEEEKDLDWYLNAAEQGDAEAQCKLGWLYLYGDEHLGLDKNNYEALDWLSKAAEQGFSEAQNKLGEIYFFGLGGVDEDYKRAFSWYLKAAEQGEESAQYWIGWMYLEGEGVGKDYKEAFKWLMKSAEQGNYFAQYELGEMYYYGRGVEEDERKAFEWYLKAAQQGLAEAQYRIGYMYYYEKVSENIYVCTIDGVVFENNNENNEQISFEWYMKAAEKGHTEAQYQIGYMYYYGRGVEENEQKAFEWFLKAAEQGYVIAQYELGEMYYYGRGIEKDERKAFEWYLKVAEKGVTKAQIKLGDMYRYGKGINENHDKALEWYMKATEDEYADEVYNKIALFYDNVRKDEKEAFRWYMKAAEKDYNWGQYNVGYCYEYGSGIEKDKQKAFEWYMKAAEKGLSDAQIKLGDMYSFGEGVNENHDKALEWYMKAAEYDNAKAYNSIGLIYGDVRKDKNEAFKWYMKAAEKDYGWGQYNVGYCYEIGIGVKENEIESLKWYKKAAENGISKAMIKIATHYYHDEKNTYLARTYLEQAMEKRNLAAAAIYAFITTSSDFSYDRTTGDLWIEDDNMAYMLYEKKIDKARQAYAGDLVDNVLVLWDATFFGSSDEGFLITKDLQIVSHLDKIPLSLQTDYPRNILDKMKFFKGKDELKNAVVKLADLAKKYGCV